MRFIIPFSSLGPRSARIAIVTDTCAGNYRCRLHRLGVETAISGANNSSAVLNGRKAEESPYGDRHGVRQSLEKASVQLPQFQQARVPTEWFGKELFFGSLRAAS